MPRFEKSTWVEMDISVQEFYDGMDADEQEEMAELLAGAGKDPERVEEFLKEMTALVDELSRLRTAGNLGPLAHLEGKIFHLFHTKP